MFGECFLCFATSLLLLVQSMCFQLRKLDFHTRKVEPSNSLTKRVEDKLLQCVDTFEFPQNRDSFTGMQSLFFYHSVLPFNVFEINSGM